jgi:hypothetical protein
MRPDDLNDTELRTILRNKGIPLDALIDRGRAIDWVTVEAEPDEKDRFVLTLIDRWRGAILLWAWENWERIYYQISCPLGEQGCWACSDFRVVSCLVNNDETFNTADKEEFMANWGDVLKMVASKGAKDASSVLDELSKTNLTGDAKSLELALLRLATEVFDILKDGKAKPIYEYVTMEVGKEKTPKAFEFVSGKNPKAVIEELSILLRDYGGNGQSAPSTPSTGMLMPPSAPPSSQPQSTGMALPASAPPSQPPVAASTPSGDAYFPGVKPVTPPTQGDRDASAYLKSESAQPPVPAIALRDISVVPVQPGIPPMQDAAPPAPPKATEPAPQAVTGPPAEPEPASAIEQRMKENREGILEAHFDVVEALKRIGEGFTDLSVAYERLTRAKFSRPNPPPQEVDVPSVSDLVAMARGPEAIPSGQMYVPPPRNPSGGTTAIPDDDEGIDGSED